MAPSETTIIEVSEVSLAKAFIAVQAAANKKGEAIQVLDLREVSGFTEYFVICTVHSDRQGSSGCGCNRNRAKRRMDSRRSALRVIARRWIVVDYGDVVVHIFHDALRDYYDLESLWRDAKKVPVPSELYIPSTQH